MTSPREEAERLIATVLGGASVAAEGLKGFATGSPECCVCPICKAIAAARDPSPELAERLAGGAGELASGLAGVLRAFAGAAGSMASSAAGAASAAAGAAAGAGTDRAADDPWRAATRGEPTPAPEAAAPAAPAKPMAKKATKPKQAASPPQTGTDPDNGSDGAAPAQEEQK